MADGAKIERLRDYLRALSPRARGLLIRELERSILRGDEYPGTQLVLQQLRGMMREQRGGGSRVSYTARRFFRPLEPFLVDDRGDRRHPGRISRSSLEHLWIWVRRDLLREDAKGLVDHVSDALLAGDEPRAEPFVRVFQDRAAEAIAAALDAAAGADEKAERRLQAQITTPLCIEEASTLRAVLQGRDALAELAAQLPLQIGDLANSTLDTCKSLIDGTAERHRDLFVYALLMVMSRLAAPWQLIRLATSATGSDSATRISESRYGIAVTIVLAELERLIDELRADLRGGRGIAVAALLKTIHDCLRALRVELALPADHLWGRAVATQRTQLADMLRFEIDNVPGRVRRLLRVRVAGDIRPHSVLNAEDVAETEMLLEFTAASRSFAGELAISEVIKRTLSTLKDDLDRGTRSLVESIRQAGEADRSFRRSQLAAAVRFCAAVLEPDHAAELGRVAQSAGTLAA